MRANIIDEDYKILFYFDNFGNLLSLKNNEIVGNMTNKKYLQVTINGKKYLVHRILYQFYHNVILEPTDIIDHIDKNTLNNTKENLRKCNKSENCCNRKIHKNTKSGHKNIYINNKTNHYQIRITKNKKITHFDYNMSVFSLDQVIKIRDDLLKNIHKNFSSNG